VKKWKMTDLQWNALVASGGVVDAQRREIAWWPSQKALNGRDIYPTLVQKPDIDLEEYEAVHEFLRPELVRLIECKQVLIDGPTFQNSPFWNLHPWLCEDVTIRNIHVRNPWYAQNGDGLDLDSCRNVLVSHATFDVGDDAICLKSGKDGEGRKLNAPTENVIVQDCTVYHGHGGFVIGSEMSGNVRNIKVSRCTFMGTDIGLRFKSIRGRGGVVEQVAIDDITLINIEKDAILFDLYYETSADNSTSPASVPITEETPQIRDITITHVICRGAERAILLRGLPEMPLRNIRFEHLHLIAKNGITRVNTENIAFHDVLIEDPHGNTILCS
jgi:polygalacturonase